MRTSHRLVCQCRATKLVGISLFAFVVRAAGAQQMPDASGGQKSSADSVPAVLTLDDALREARAANAQLPGAALE
ncbi:MAG: hypothetical protein ACRD3J_31950, partial [Thermoanaerobaculia bacterium]